MHIEPYASIVERLDRGMSFVESLAGTIRDINDRSLRDLASESFSDWTEFLTPELLTDKERLAIGRAYQEEVLADDPETRNLDDIYQLIKQVKRKIPVKAASDIEAKFVKWKEAYANDS
jgi:hypothetical protein